MRFAAAAAGRLALMNGTAWKTVSDTNPDCN
jgi:hypothetical protein